MCHRSSAPPTRTHHAHAHTHTHLRTPAPKRRPTIPHVPGPCSLLLTGPCPRPRKCSEHLLASAGYFRPGSQRFVECTRRLWPLPVLLHIGSSSSKFALSLAPLLPSSLKEPSPDFQGRAIHFFSHPSLLLLQLVILAWHSLDTCLYVSRHGPGYTQRPSCEADSRCCAAFGLLYPSSTFRSRPCERRTQQSGKVVAGVLFILYCLPSRPVCHFHDMSRVCRSILTGESRSWDRLSARTNTQSVPSAVETIG